MISLYPDLIEDKPMPHVMLVGLSALPYDYIYHKPKATTL